ncbi:MAG: hypothetical protein K2L95_02925 [Alphaproteobacteria bacterium]|nr:hypothetical protein [Alphaproteobacteria bacterium]
MTHKKQTKSIRTPKTNTSVWTRLRARLRWGYVAAALIAVVVVVGGGIMWRGAHRSTTPQFELSVGAPDAQQFRDDNFVTMLNDDAANTPGLPDVNNDREISAPAALRIGYDQTRGEYTPALRMDINDADLADAIKITPFIKGTWHRAGTARLFFTPDTAWPADQQFTVTLSRKLFNDDVRVNKLRATFRTPKLVGTVNSFDVYPDMNRRQSMIAVGIVSFNYPVNTTEFESHTTVKLNGKKLDFSVKFDNFHRTAFITTEPIAVGDAAQNLRLVIDGVAATTGRATSAKLTADTTIESADNLFRISSVTTNALDNNATDAQQLLIINMTAAAATTTKWDEYIDLYLLPAQKDDDDATSHRWMADEITDAVLQQSRRLTWKSTDFVNPAGVYQYAFEYDVAEQNDRYIYAVVRPGIVSDSGFVLKNGISKIMRVPYPERAVKIAGSGALLSMGGDRQLGIMARGGVATAYVNLYKVKSDEINHLITQTYNVFTPLEFKSWSFDAYDMAVVFQKRISFANPSPKRVNYASVDLGAYLDKTPGDKTGIFIIQTGASQDQADYTDKRLILLTDLGIIRKTNIDGTSTVFVSRLATGRPAVHIDVNVLGRNGNPIWVGQTDAGGRANIPNLPWSEYKNARAPVAIVVRDGSDVSFIPYYAGSQQVEYSKFDVDGVYASATTPMNAFIFSDRGIYRPGEEFIIGGIVKEKSFKSLAGIPVRLDIRDARGRVIVDKVFSLAADGMFDATHQLSTQAPIGEYDVRLFSLNAKNQNQDILGRTTIRVEEFVPDTLKISAKIDGATDTGWIAPDDVHADVTLRNLFGTAAADRRITAHAVLTPAQFTFAKFTDYTFTPNFIAGTGLARASAGAAQTRHFDLPDATTDENGMARINVTFDPAVTSGTYTLALTLRGFEGASGKNVQMTTTARISPAKYLLGWRANGDLSYVNRGAARHLHIVAVNHNGDATAAGGLTMRLIKKENLTSLIKDYNDYYKYQTVTRERIIRQDTLDIAAGGYDMTLDTGTPGTYYMQILDDDDRVLANVEYFVAGAENTELKSDTTAQLQIKLNKSEYAAGDDIAVNITAPYAGTGLITIERDRVYAYRWFTADTTTSTQHITVPDNFEGTGYINVSFVRDINSRDVFTTPYTFAVAPFTANVAKRDIHIRLAAPEIIRDRKLTIEYTTDKNARMMLFAVNQGILQVARFQMPQPLGYFFKKAALQVDTYQILSLLLPEYNVLREFAKTGGGDYADDGNGMGPLTNPFARKSGKPVAFYSGIIQTTANRPGHVTFDIPDDFNGALRIFAVAANNSSVGATDITSHVQSPLIISVTSPLVAAPGDTFDVGAVITNMTDDNTDASVTATATVSDNLAITTDGSGTQTVAQSADGLWTFGVRATDKLGAADVTIAANAKNGTGTTTGDAHATATMSVRPITAFTTDIKTGVIESTQKTVRKFHLDLYPEFAIRQLYISPNASAFIKPLFEYLNHYEYTCSEQLVSRTMPYVFMPDDAILGTTGAVATDKIASTIATLKNRQNDDGSFSLWAGGARERANESDAATAYVTAYVVQFLTLAKENGFTVPATMLARGVDYLRTYAGVPMQSPSDALAKSFAIYVVTQNGYVTTSYINMFEEYANQNAKNWQSGLAGTYIAASYKILKQDDAASKIVRKYRPTDDDKTRGDAFGNRVADDATYMYLTHTYFDAVTPAYSDGILAYINGGRYDAFTAAAVIMGLTGNGTAGHMDNITVRADDTPMAGAVTRGAWVGDIPENATTLTIECPTAGADAPLFYTLMQQGFPRTTAPQSNGIEITREYYNADGRRIDSAEIGQDITVKIFARATGGTNAVANVVITDLLPGGLTALGDTLSGDMDYAAPGEDRVLIFTDLTRRGREFTYTATATAAGTFTVPPITAASMYNPQIHATAKSATFQVNNVASN